MEKAIFWEPKTRRPPYNGKNKHLSSITKTNISEVQQEHFIFLFLFLSLFFQPIMNTRSKLFDRSNINFASII